MKKILLTVFAAAAMGIAAMAQEGDTTRTESNQYRRDQNQTDSTEMRDDMNRDRILNESDSLSQDAERESTNLRDNARETRDSLQQDAQQASDELGNEARQTRDSLEQDAERIGDDIEAGAQSTSDSVEKDAKELGNYLQQSAAEGKDKVEKGAESVKEDAEQAGQTMQQGVKDAGNNIRHGNDRALDTRQAEEDNTRTTAQDQQNQVDGAQSQTSQATTNAGNMNQSASAAIPSAIEVVQEKEGPNNEVVYSFNGEMWYVDRESKQMVKADESKLKDSKHKVMVHEGASDVAKSRSQRGKSKS